MTVKIYTIKEVAEILKLHYQTVYRWIESGEMKCVKIGRNLRVTEKQLEEFIDKNKED